MQAQPNAAEVQRILGYLDQTDDDGRPVFPDETLKDFIPLVVLTMGEAISADDASEPLQMLMGEFALRAGITVEMKPNEQLAAAQAYFKAKPVPPGLEKGFWDLLREMLLDRQADGPSDAAQKLMGAEKKTSRAPKGAAPAAAKQLRTQLAGGIKRGIGGSKPSGD